MRKFDIMIVHTRYRTSNFICTGGVLQMDISEEAREQDRRVGRESRARLEPDCCST
jgi:hypothetical protein